MPNPTDAIARLSRPKIGNAYSGPGSRGAVDEQGRRAARRARQLLDRHVVAAGGAQAGHVPGVDALHVVRREQTSDVGRPLGSFRTSPASSTTHPPISQSQWSMPLANGHRPVTRSESPSTVARPLGANTPPQQRARRAVYLARVLLGQVGRQRTARAGHRHAPRGRAVAARERRDRVDHLGGLHLAAAARAGHQHAEQPGARPGRPPPRARAGARARRAPRGGPPWHRCASGSSGIAPLLATAIVPIVLPRSTSGPGCRWALRRQCEDARQRFARHARRAQARRDGSRASCSWPPRPGCRPLPLLPGGGTDHWAVAARRRPPHARSGARCASS